MIRTFSYLPDTVLYSFHAWAHLIPIRTLNEVDPINPFLQEKLRLSEISYLLMAIFPAGSIYLWLFSKTDSCLIFNLCLFVRK